MDVTFDNSYVSLSDRFYTRIDPSPVSEPGVVRVNERLAQRLGFDPDWLASDEGAEFAVGNRILEGSEPIATVYAGHQFGGFVPRLGDGRAHLLGEVLDENGERFDIQLKGSGQTPYSRRGDGRSPLGPVLREYIVSEAMAALGIPTTRSLVAATTGERVHRRTSLPGGVLVRVARSHIRIGTFEYFAARDDADAVRQLFEYVIARHYPELDPATPLELLRVVAERQARLIAQWMLVGFIHGVMNTDNMLLSGETIDYGPCAFMNEYDPSTVYSSIDRRGRYAYGNQPPIAQWNLSRLAGTLSLITDRSDTDAAVHGIIERFGDTFRQAYAEGMARKLGLSEFTEDDWALVEDLLEWMYETSADYTLTFRHLNGLATADDGARSEGLTDDVLEPDETFETWRVRWEARLADDPLTVQDRIDMMSAANPVLIPRNHVVESAIAAAVDHGDFDRFHALVDALSNPYDSRDAPPELLRPPRPEERVEATFCGT